MDDAELKHALEFPLSRLETVRSEASGSGRDRRTSRFDMMVDIVLHWSVGLSDLSEGWKLGQEGEVGAGGIPGAEGGSGGGRGGENALYL